MDGEGRLQSEQDVAYATDLRLLQYLRARDLSMGGFKFRTEQMNRYSDASGFVV